MSWQWGCLPRCLPGAQATGHSSLAGDWGLLGRQHMAPSHWTDGRHNPKDGVGLSLLVGSWHSYICFNVSKVYSNGHYMPIDIGVFLCIGAYVKINRPTYKLGAWSYQSRCFIDVINNLNFSGDEYICWNHGMPPTSTNSYLILLKVKVHMCVLIWRVTLICPYSPE